jgi:glycosyltransferase involved in cell wall biosynthesis
VIKISIISAVYNNRNYIQFSIDSFITQSFKNKSHIVIDGNSNDGTKEFLLENKSYFSTLISENDSGVYDALNKGLKLAKGDVVGLLHSDDFYANQDVLKKISKIFSNPKVDIVYGDLDYVSHDDPPQIIRHWRAGEFSLDKLKLGWMPPHPTFFIRRKLLNKIGGFDTDYKIAADYDLMLRALTQKNVNAVYLPEVLIKMRVGGMSNRSLKNTLLKSYEDYKIIRHHKIGGIGTLLFKNLSKISQFFH